MRAWAVLIILALILDVAAVGQKKRTAWQPGVFRGLVMGKATKEEMVKVLGEPASAPQQVGASQVFSYPGKGEFEGNVEAVVGNNVVEAVIVRMPRAVPRSVAFRTFGQDFKEGIYATANCPDVVDVWRLYRSRRGIVLIEYPQKGMVLWPDQYGYDIASAVYVARPFPAVAPPCAKADNRKAH